MIMDHIKYLKAVIESTIVGSDGSTHILDKRFYEVYPKPSEIERLCPCAVLAHRPGRMTKNGTRTDRTVDEEDITITQTLYDADGAYQVDFYSLNIYDFLEKDGTYTGLLKQFMDIIANNDPFCADSDGRAISVTLGAFGVIDTSIVTDGIYKAYCQVIFRDGIYKDVTVPKITGVIINEGGIS